MGEFVSEFPMPPNHYKRFETVESLAPPELSDGEGLELTREYKTNMGMQMLGDDNDSNTFEVGELKSHLYTMLRELMELAANPRIDPQSGQPRMEDLQKSMDSVMEYVKLYKHHQAREELCDILRSQLSRTLETERELQR